MTINSATTISTIKFTGYIWAASMFNYLNIEEKQITILAGLMIIDFTFGVIRQFCLDSSSITSHKAWLGVFKKGSTLGLVLSMGLVFKGINLDGSDYIQGMLGIFIMAEGYSIARSVYAIRTGKMLPEYDVISITIKKLGDYIINLIDKKN